MRKLGIGYYLNAAGTDMAYGSSDGTTASNATTPDLLIEGSIGMYGVLKTGVSTDLITGSSTLALYSSFMIYQGGKNETILLSQFTGSELESINSIAYLKPTKQVSFVGWNGVSGSLNMGTVAVGDSGQIQMNQRVITNNPISSYFLIGDSGKLAAAATGYAALAPTLAQLNSNRGNVQPRKGTWQIVCDATTLTATTTGTVIKYVKDSTTAYYYIDNSTSGLVASTGNAAAGDIISIPAAVRGVSFTSPYTSAKKTLVTIGATQYLISDTTDAATTAALIAAAINAGTQAYATVTGGSSDVVNIYLLPSIYESRITVRHITGASTGADVTLTTIYSSGNLVPTVYKVASAATSGQFELDYPFQGETGFYSTGTDLLLTTGKASVITEYGAKFMASNYFEEFTTQLNGVFANATLTYGNGTVTSSYTTLTVSGATVASSSVALKPTSGSGEFSEERLLEMYGRYYRGAVDTYSAVAKTPTTFYTKEGKGYDNYSIVIKPLRSDGSGLNATSSNEYVLDMGFEHFNLTASTGDNQYVWEAVLDLFVTAYPKLAYTSLV